MARSERSLASAVPPRAPTLSTHGPCSFKGDVTLEGVRDFERQFFAGELTPHMRSQVPVLADTRGPVTAVKGQTFHKLVMDNGEPPGIVTREPLPQDPKGFSP